MNGSGIKTQDGDSRPKAEYQKRVEFKIVNWSFLYNLKPGPVHYQREEEAESKAVQMR